MKVGGISIANPIHVRKNELAEFLSALLARRTDFLNVERPLVERVFAAETKH